MTRSYNLLCRREDTKAMNIKKFYFYKLIQHLVPIYPVYLLLFESKGLSVSQISMLLAIWSIPVVLLEIPTGILADHWNRKYMLIIGSLCKALCYVCWFFSDGFLLFAIGFALWGISESLCSGSEEALLFDSLKQQAQEDKFEQVYGKCNFYSNIGVAISGITGGLLSMTIGMKPVLVISIVSMVVCIVVASGFKEVNYFVQRHYEKPRNRYTQLLMTLRDAVTLCTKNLKLLTIILMSILVIGMAGILDEYDPLIADRYGLNLALVGVWGSTRYILEAIGGRIAYKVKSTLAKFKINDQFYAIFIMCIIAGVFLGISGWARSIIIMPLYGLFYLIMASARVLHEDFVQQQIEEQGRSTVHSLISLIDNLYSIAFFGIFAFILSGVDLHKSLIYISLYILFVCLSLWIMYTYVKRKATC